MCKRGRLGPTGPRGNLWTLRGDRAGRNGAGRGGTGRDGAGRGGAAARCAGRAGPGRGELAGPQPPSQCCAAGCGLRPHHEAARPALGPAPARDSPWPGSPACSRYAPTLRSIPGSVCLPAAARPRVDAPLLSLCPSVRPSGTALWVARRNSGVPRVRGLLVGWSLGSAPPQAPWDLGGAGCMGGRWPRAGGGLRRALGLWPRAPVEGVLTHGGAPSPAEPPDR